MKKVSERPGGSIQSAGEVGIDSEAVRLQVERLLANQLFYGSRRYTNLLRYIVDRTLEGHQDDLKERVIGIEVFGRTPDYDTSFDATVRVAAAEVRKRLTLYYSESGHEQELRIEVPAGSYMAEFRLPELKRLPPDVLPIAKREKTQYWYFAVPLAIAVLSLAGWGGQRLLSPEAAIDRFWAPLLHSSSPAVICIDAPPIPKPSNPNDSVAPGNEQVS
jgi:hypothetical protein